MEELPFYQMISDVDELRWFFDHVLCKPQVNESYSMVFVSRHKKLTKEEQETIGLTRRESEFLATQTVRVGKFKNVASIDESTAWTFDNFLKRIRRFNVDKYAYTTALGQPIPTKTLAIIFYVNPCDDMKVCRAAFEEYLDVSNGIAKAMLGGKLTEDVLHGYQWFGNFENNIKHLKATCKGSRYWMDFDIDVPKWFKTGQYVDEGYERSYYADLVSLLSETFGKGNYIIVDTSGGYHVLVRTTSIRANPHNLCAKVKDIYDFGLAMKEEPYVDDKGNCKFECIVNDSQIPGIPLPGTYQYDRPVTVLNKEDFE